MADTPAGGFAARLIDVPLANGSLSSLSPIIFSSVRFYHAILVGHHPIEPFTTVADASQFSEQRQQRRANFGRRHPMPPRF